MKKTEKISGGKNYTAVNIGRLESIGEHSLIHPVNGQKIDGKVFLKEATEATGTEISFQMLPPHDALSYFHIHNQNEETYIVIRGKGDFQVDDDCFEVTEGSVVRIAPAGIRSLRNSSNEPMIYMVIQSRKDSLEQYSSGDGTRVEHRRLWE